MEDNETAPRRARSPIQIIGLALFCLGVFPLMIILAMDPYLIEPNVNSYSNDQFIFLRWVFVLCPLSAICGAIFIAAGTLERVLNNKK